MRVKLIALPPALALLLGAAAASTAPPPQSPIDNVETTESRVEPATGVSLGSFKVTFESTTFTDLARLGDAPIAQMGDAGEFVMWVCFTLSRDRQRLWFTSSELGGRKYVTGAIAQVLPADASASPDCPELPTQFRPVRLDSGAWLGTTLENLQQQFGPPWKTGSTAQFAYLGKDREYDVMSTLVVELEDQRVVALYANHSTTN
jgi:hypothetical protein